MKKDLIILTNQFPGGKAKSENWLFTELEITFKLFKNITIIPLSFELSDTILPPNVFVLNIIDEHEDKDYFTNYFNIIKIVCSDFLNYPSKINFLKSFRYNIALLKNLNKWANKISSYRHLFYTKPILYAYWAGDLATMACIIKQKYHDCIVVTRGHGFEVFEEQTRYGVIPFRFFQYRYLTKIYTDSKRGLSHLNSHPKFMQFKEKNDYAYVGTLDKGISAFSEQAVFTIVTCSFVRSIKRLYLMPEILKHVKLDLIWHVLGDGEELSLLKESVVLLPSHIKVIFHGALPNEKILDFYALNSINLFVSLSSSEGLPVSMMEALSFGIPIMSTDVGGCNEICNEHTGFLIEKEFNPVEVAKKMEFFKNSTKNTKEFHSQCKAYWNNHFNAETNYRHFAHQLINLK